MGCIRIICENSLRIRLADLIRETLARHLVFASKTSLSEGEFVLQLQVLFREQPVTKSVSSSSTALPNSEVDQRRNEYRRSYLEQISADLLTFFADRLKVQLREQGARHDLVDAVFSLKDQDDLVLVVRRVEALAALLATEDGQNLVAGYKRAANILRIEEKRDGVSYDGPPDETLYIFPEEVALALALTDTM